MEVMRKTEKHEMEKLRLRRQYLNHQGEVFKKSPYMNASATNFTKLEVTKGTLPNEFNLK